MRPTPLFLSACALVSIAGAVSGAVINTVPIQQASIGSEEIRRPPIAFDPADTGYERDSLPDHYAMTTPLGRVEVAELANRGLYAQPRYGWRAAEYEAPTEPAFSDDATQDFGALAHSEDAASMQAAASVPVAASVQPALAIAEPTSLLGTSNGQPRVIDVSAVLAAR